MLHVVTSVATGHDVMRCGRPSRSWCMVNNHKTPVNMCNHTSYIKATKHP